MLAKMFVSCSLLNNISAVDAVFFSSVAGRTMNAFFRAKRVSLFSKGAYPTPVMPGSGHTTQNSLMQILLLQLAISDPLGK